MVKKTSERTKRTVLTAEEASLVLGLHIQTVRRMLRNGVLAGRKSSPTDKGTWLIPARSVERFLKGQKNG